MTLRQGLPVALAHKRWYSCDRKPTYPSHAEAEIVADHLENDVSRPHSYDCEWCGGIHLGRPQKPNARKHPLRKAVRRRFDLTDMLELGERVLACGRAESEGPRVRRVAAIRGRAVAAQKRRISLTPPRF